MSWRKPLLYATVRREVQVVRDDRRAALARLQRRDRELEEVDARRGRRPREFPSR